VRQQRGDQLLLADRAALGLEHQAHRRVLVRLVARGVQHREHGRLQLHLLLRQRLLAELDLGVGQLLDLFQHLLRAGAMRQLVDDQLPLAARQVLDAPARAQLEAAAAAGVGGADVGRAADELATAGEVGPGQQREQSSSPSCSCFSSATVAAATSRRLWLGTSVAMPTAMPLAPLSSENGSRAGSSFGSWYEPS
jgi:hypothetical protein